MTTQFHGTRRSRRRSILILAAAGIAVMGILLVSRLTTPGSTATPAATPRDAAAAGTPSGTARLAHAVPPASASPEVKLSESQVDPDVARKAALEYEKGRFNAFFDDKAFLASSLASGKLSVKAVKDQLLSTDELKALPPGVLVLTSKPAAVVERMALIDTLEAMIDDDATALDALAEIGLTPIDSSLAVQTKRAVAAEKYDVFVALARKNWELAKQTYLDLHNPALMDLLKPALIGGLVDSGLSRAQAVSTVEALTGPASSQDG
jgi:hypothetical protein